MTTGFSESIESSIINEYLQETAFGKIFTELAPQIKKLKIILLWTPTPKKKKKIKECWNSSRKEKKLTDKKNLPHLQPLHQKI